MNITVNRQNDPAYELLLDDLICEIFGFSFAPWFDQQLWDERYESYSIIRDGKMTANACIYKSDLLINGQSIRAHQFGAIATRKDQRGKGLSRLLIQHVLSLYPDTPAFLFANPSVVDFYPRFGFSKTQTYRPGIAVTLNNSSDTDIAVKYRLDDDFVRKLLCRKRVYSKIVDSLNMQPIQIFHLLLAYPEDIYYLPGCDTLVIAVQEGEKLFLADVVAQKPIAFDDLIEELPFHGVKFIEFGFCPDWLGVNPCWEPIDGSKESFFIKGNLNFPELFRLPVTSVT